MILEKFEEISFLLINYLLNNWIIPILIFVSKNIFLTILLIIFLPIAFKILWDFLDVCKKILWS